MSHRLRQPRTAPVVHLVLVLAILAGLALAWQPLRVQPVYAAATFPDPVGPNLITNGSFEDPPLTDHSISQTNTLPGWTVPNGQNVEIQHNAAGAAQAGQQLLELDAQASGSIAQTIPTIAGTVYELTYAYSPRPTFGPDDNAVGVYWNNTLQTTTTADGSSNQDTVWQTASLTVVATSSTATVGFRDAGISNSFGMYLDTVVVRAATCATKASGTWTDPATWSCAGAAQVPGPGNYDVISSGTTIDTSGLSFDIDAVMLLLHDASTLMRKDNREMRMQTLQTEHDSMITAANNYKDSATLAADSAVISGWIQAAGSVVAGAMSVVAAGSITSSTIDVSGSLKLADQASITGKSDVTVTGTVTLAGQSKIADQTALTTYTGIQVGDQASIDQTRVSMVWSQVASSLSTLVTGSGSITNSTFDYQAAETTADAKYDASIIAALDATAQQNQLYMQTLIAQTNSFIDFATLTLAGIEQTQLSVIASNMASSPTPSSMQFATVGTLADLGTPGGVVALTSASPVTIDALTVDAGQVLQIGANTNVTLTGPITNNGAITLTDATSSLTLAPAATIITSGTLTDAQPATVSPLSATTPIHVGGTVTATASLTDTALDTHHAVWTWGDGSTAQLPVNDATGSASATHQYLTTGTYTISLVVWDAGGNASTPVTTTVTIVSTTAGFFQPVDMAGVVNTVKAGATVPLKFKVFKGAGGTNESTQVADIKSLTATTYSCSATAPTDDIEVVTTGATSLRYDATAGQFVYNWQTPKNGVGTCYAVTMTTQDGSILTTLFKLK